MSVLIVHGLGGFLHLRRLWSTPRKQRGFLFVIIGIGFTLATAAVPLFLGVLAPIDSCRTTGKRSGS